MNTRELILAALKSPKGMVPSHLPEASYRQAGSIIRQLSATGRCFKAAGHTKRAKRYFDTPERAAAYRAPVIPKAPKFVRTLRGSAPWSPDAKPRITSETRVTICPAFPQPSRSNTWEVF